MLIKIIAALFLSSLAGITVCLLILHLFAVHARENRPNTTTPSISTAKPAP